MSEPENNLITLRLEGFESEDGHIRLLEFIAQLEKLLVTLNDIDRIVGDSNRPALYYRVVNATHSSPITITLEPVVKESAPKSASNTLVSIRHHRFFQELTAIRENTPISPDIDDSTLEHLHDLVSGLGQDFKSATISNNVASVPLDQTFEENIGKLVDEGFVSYGRFEGKLKAVNLHGGNRFWIYPKSGPQRVRCDFLPGTASEIRKALDHDVVVEGLKHFRPQNPFPNRISVRELEIIEEDPSDHLIHLKGMAAGSLAEMSSVDFVRMIRDEW